MLFDVPFFVHIQGVALGPLIEPPIKMDPLRGKHAMHIQVCQVERNQQLYATDCFMWTSTNQRGVVFQVFAGCDVVYACIYIIYLQLVNAYQPGGCPHIARLMLSLG